MVLPLFILVALATFFLAAPLYHFYLENPAWAWLFSFPGSGLLDLGGPVAATGFGLGVFSFFAVVGFAIYRGFHPLLITGVAYLVVIVVFQAVSLSQGLFAGDVVSGYVQRALTEFLALQEAAKAPMEQVALVKENMAGFSHLFALLFPSFVFCALFFILLVNFSLGRRLFLISGKTGNSLFKLNEWRVPFMVVWAAISAIALYLANSTFLKSPVGLALSANFLVILAFVYTLQGFAILSYFLEKKKVRPFSRALIYGLIVILFQPFIFLVTGLGFFDSWSDLRQKLEKSRLPKK